MSSRGLRAEREQAASRARVGRQGCRHGGAGDLGPQACNTQRRRADRAGQRRRQARAGRQHTAAAGEQGTRATTRGGGEGGGELKQGGLQVAKPREAPKAPRRLPQHGEVAGLTQKMEDASFRLEEITEMGWGALEKRQNAAFLRPKALKR